MQEDLNRRILETEYNVLNNQLAELGDGALPDTSPKKDGTLDHLSLQDLRQAVKMIRDLARTLGGIKGR